MIGHRSRPSLRRVMVNVSSNSFEALQCPKRNLNDIENLEQWAGRLRNELHLSKEPCWWPKKRRPRMYRSHTLGHCLLSEILQTPILRDRLQHSLLWMKSVKLAVLEDRVNTGLQCRQKRTCHRFPVKMHVKCQKRARK